MASARLLGDDLLAGCADLVGGDQPCLLAQEVAAAFAGAALVAPVFGPDMGSVSAREVTFLPGARSAWRTHAAGQKLIVTAGSGWVQERGQPKTLMQAGDVIWCPTGVEHWHGAPDTPHVTHFAIQQGVDGAAVTWGAKVTDAEYLD